MHSRRTRVARVLHGHDGARLAGGDHRAVEGLLLDLAEVLVFTARNRKESRGGHMREDYENRDDENYMQHTMAYLTGDPHSPDPEDHIRLDWKPVVFTKNEQGELKYPPMERMY